MWILGASMSSLGLCISHKKGTCGSRCLLVEHGADCGSPDSNGSTPLHHASLGGHVRAGRLLIEHGGRRRSPGQRWETPLLWASWRGQRGAGAALIEHGADAAARGNDGATPLHRASLEVAWAGAAPHRARRRLAARAKNDEGTPLHWASRRGHVNGGVAPHRARRRRGQPGQRTREHHWHLASWMGHVEWRGSSSSKAPTCSPGQRRGDTAALSSWRGGVEVEWPHRVRADVAARPTTGGHHCTGHPGWVTWRWRGSSFEHGADVAARANDEGPTALGRLAGSRGGSAAPHRARRRRGTGPMTGGHRCTGPPGVTWMWCGSSSITAPTRQPRPRTGNTAPWACWWGHVEVTGFLIENGTERQPGPRTGTPLHWASCRGHVDAVRAPHRSTDDGAVEPLKWVRGLEVSTGLLVGARASMRSRS